MPKIKQRIEEDEDSEEVTEQDVEEESEPEEEEEIVEDDELENEPVRKPKANPLRKGMTPKQIGKIEVKRRFGIVAPQTVKIVDTESNEVVGDGEFAVIQALTDILERLERIETAIGTMNP
jgi:hypothetical protein